MLSEKSQMLSESRTKVEALRVYTTKRIAQLKQLRQDTESSNKQKIGLLEDSENLNKQKTGLLVSDKLESSDSSLSLIASKKKLTQVILRGSISRTLPMISSQTIIPKPELSYNIQLKWSFGIIDSSVRNSFSSVLLARYPT